MAFLDLMTQAWDLSNQSLYGMYQNLVLRDRDSIAYSERDLATEIPLVLGWTFVITIFLYSLRNYILEPIGGWFLKTTKPVLRRRFADSASELIFYGAFTYMGYNIWITHHWVWPSAAWWDGHYIDEHLMRNDLRGLYLLDTARYLACLVSVRFLEHERKDKTEMTIHHIATTIVTVIAYGTGHSRIGAIVKMIMDPADVPLHLAKACKYGGDHRKSKVLLFCADRFFELFAITFFVTRLIMFGYVMYSSTVEGRIKCNWTPFQNFGLAQLYVLYALQVFWFSLIVKMAWRMASGKGVVDIRSDSEDSDYDGQQEKSKPIARKKNSKAKSKKS
ncbi:hypothetical protein ScalyP_jg3658 [Parmales sp. scaly parma]|nr:hypothetical protein ScalyP_jg3658 [Parmales sp. scaly parma]